MHDRTVGAERLGAAFEDRRVAGFEAQPGSISSHVGAGLVDHANDAEGHPHLADLQSIGPAPHRYGFANWVGKVSDDLHPLRYGIDPRLG